MNMDYINRVAPRHGHDQGWIGCSDSDPINACDQSPGSGCLRCTLLKAASASTEPAGYFQRFEYDKGQFRHDQVGDEHKDEHDVYPLYAAQPDLVTALTRIANGATGYLDRDSELAEIAREALSSIGVNP